MLRRNLIGLMSGASVFALAVALIGAPAADAFAVPEVKISHGTVKSIDAEASAFMLNLKDGGELKLKFTDETRFIAKDGKNAPRDDVLIEKTAVVVMHREDLAIQVSSAD